VAKEDSSCGDWEPFKDEKCFKIMDKAGLQTYDNAIKTCEQEDQTSNLLSIRSLREQEFLNKFLFVTNEVVDEIWIGLKNKSNKFEWNDGTELEFTNWADKSPTNKIGNNCVQIEPEDSSRGKWNDRPCNRKNLVVCQKMQIWSSSRIQNTLLDKSKKLINLENNPVPIGFIYTQIPGQPEPKKIWPNIDWKDITSEYAGLFFRAEGANSAKFEELQSDSSPRLIAVTSVFRHSDIIGTRMEVKSGEVSKTIYSGTYGDGNNYGFKFEVSGGEVRPTNKAIRIWKRIK
jgi:hypothetical protein